MNIVSAPTREVVLWMAGDMATAQRVLREHCYDTGACFAITATKFIYTGGEEDGFSVSLVNYPRFPSTDVELMCRAQRLAEKLMRACNQRTALVVGGDATHWLVLDPPGSDASSR